MRQLLLALTPLLALAGAPGAMAEDQAKPGLDMSPAEREAFQSEIRDYLLANPEILNEMVRVLDQRQKAQASMSDRELVAKNADAIFDDGYSWVTGNPEGGFTLVEFLDYQCGYCHKAMPELTELLSSDGDIKMIVKDFPILGPGSELAARATTATMIAEGPEAYGRLHDVLMAGKGQITDESLDRAMKKADLDPKAIRAAMEDPEVDRRIAANRALADQLAITGTPTFVFQSDMVRGYVALADMRKIVDELRGTN
ncbi:MAG: disulfide bond formation protein DsbA [Rhodovulum sulfidophilum]|uniref:Disulfide bond formation protein DsbA n=1 Tax=Rhodovulum sulfidophilum TaxID=35806 RepID=A0A2W5N9F4_RHOSU|nr:MAG: disulfide bond formation protein DsbA [Rhodovulum sulfidophilum]